MSAQIFGRSSPYFIPEYFYSAVRSRAVSPTIHQFMALSRISGYRPSDWLALFGFELDDIPRLQLLFTRPRTVLLDSTVYDEEQWIPWCANRHPTSRLPAIAPLGQILKRAEPVRASTLLALGTRRFLYAKVGTEDVFARPTLAPGSIVRIDGLNADRLASELGPTPTGRIFLVERAVELTCSRLRRLGGNKVALCSATFPFAELEFIPGRTGRILGVLDAEIRLVEAQPPSSNPRRARPNADIPPALGTPMQFGRFVQMLRLRAGLSFREASAMSHAIAKLLSDGAYSTSPGTLSDYEHRSGLPRHLQKLIALCILYSIGFWDLLRAAGVAVHFAGEESIADELRGRADRSWPQTLNDESRKGREPGIGRGFLSMLVDEWKEIPLFIRGALPQIFGIDHLSLSDIFWVGAESDPIHQHLANAELVAVNRRLKKLVSSLPRATQEQPLYMVLKRDGGYLCGSCTPERRGIAVHRHPQEQLPRVETERRIDAEIIGQVTAIVRRLS
jgi:transcriptional regulator with XRE-family HTH domain